MKITVLYQNYNQSEYIEESMNAILNQTYQAYEIIMVDDCSSDKSVEILSKYIDQKKNIRLIANKINKGTASHSNIGIDEAKGDIIYFAAADDVVLPDLFEKSIKAFKKFSNIGIFSAKIKSIDKNGNYLTDPKNSLSFLPKENYLSPSKCIMLLSNGGHWVTGQTCLWRVEFLRNHKLRFYEDLKYMLDHYLIINIASKYGAYFYNEYLAKWRYIETSYAHTNFKFNNAIIAYDNFKEKLYKNYILKNNINPKKFLSFFNINIYEMYLVDILKNIKLSIRNSSNKIICILLYVLLLFVLNPFIIYLKLRRKFYLLKIRFFIKFWN